MARDKRITRAVDPSELADMLQHPPRAIAAINSGGLVSATPVAFRLEAEFYWITTPQKITAWHYGTLGEAKRDGP